MKAFSPGSITLFFSIRDNAREYVKRGSIGVGLVIDSGAITSVEKSSETEIIVNGRPMENTVQEKILKKYKINAKVNTRTYMPISQGFGMSAAAAVSTSFSLFYGIKTYYECIEIAHRVELESGTGLGDIASISAGGFTLRMREGIPPYGFIDRIKYDINDFVVLIIDKPIETKEIIKRKEYRKKIIKAGDKAMEFFLKDRSLKNAFKVARKFSKEISINESELNEIMEKAKEYGEVAQVMIGNSLIGFGKNDALEKLFEKYGEVKRLKIYESIPKLI
ncbi:MAG: GHMP kinase [Thermoplasmata archaeon]